MKNLICVSAPSGSGKTTLCKAIREARPDLIWSVSYTTRFPRDNEINGEDYNFISKEEFNLFLNNEEFSILLRLVNCMSSNTVNPSLVAHIYAVCLLLSNFSIIFAVGINTSNPSNSLITVVTIKKINNIKIISGIDDVDISLLALVFL